MEKAAIITIKPAGAAEAAKRSERGNKTSRNTDDEIKIFRAKDDKIFIYNLKEDELRSYSE